MNIWELPKDHYNWESPITKIYGDIHNEIVRQDEENIMCTIEQAIGYKVDKGELIKALQYDREQYDKGYKDGVRETFIAELEKIKAEIGEAYPYFDSADVHWGFNICRDIIDKHISELKGENIRDCKTCKQSEDGKCAGTEECHECMWRDRSNENV